MPRSNPLSINPGSAQEPEIWQGSDLWLKRSTRTTSQGWNCSFRINICMLKTVLSSAKSKSYFKLLSIIIQKHIQSAKSDSLVKWLGSEFSLFTIWLCLESIWTLFCSRFDQIKLYRRLFGWLAAPVKQPFLPGRCRGLRVSPTRKASRRYWTSRLGLF